MKEQLTEVFSRYEGTRNELIPILQDVQDALGYLPTEAMSEVAGFLGIPESTVYGVVTFYAQFYLTRQGRHKIRVCQGTACHVRGGGRIMQTVRKRLGIKPGETTEDYEFTLERVACLGSCALAPVVVADDKVHGAMTTAKAEQLIDSLKKESKKGTDG
jgi:NADH-quinone oxidoreductase subunit E